MYDPENGPCRSASDMLDRIPPFSQWPTADLRLELKEPCYSERFTQMMLGCNTKDMREVNRDRRATDRTVRLIWLHLQRRGAVK